MSDQSTMTAEQAAQRVASIRTNPADPLHAAFDNQFHPQYGEAIDAVSRLTARAKQGDAPPPVEESPATVEARTAAMVQQQATQQNARALLAAKRAELAALDEGHFRRPALIEEISVLTRAAKGSAPAGELTGLSFNILDPPRPTPPVEPEPELVTMPPLAREARWEQGLPGLREVDVLAEKEGWLDALPGVLHMVRHAHEDGHGWTAETTAAEWERRHGPERAAELMAEATALEGHLKQSAPKFLAWVTSLGIQYDPDLLEHALRVRGRAGQGAR